MSHLIFFFFFENIRALTTQPLRVVLVCPHCVSLGQAPEDGSISPHEVNVHAGEQLLVLKQMTVHQCVIHKVEIVL